MVCSTRRFVVCRSVCYFVLVFFSPFSIAITSLGERRANLSAFRTFVRFVLVWICRFPLPLGIWEELRFVIVALPGLFSYLFFKTSCLIDVQNPYGQRSLPTFHGIVQIFSQTDDSRGSTDLKAETDLSMGWECIAEVPVTLPKSIAKINSTVYRAPSSLQLEGNLIYRITLNVKTAPLLTICPK